VFAGIGVAAGAFGAHALRDVLAPQSLEVYHTAARYQLIHALALVFTGLAAAVWPNRKWRLVGGLFTVGILVFSGSLYVLAITGIGWLGAVTPIGGVCFLGGWLVAGLIALKDAGE
jgi:uncharacterized membrane protein YgdD (TMEM256/DUF423 family)